MLHLDVLLQTEALMPRRSTRKPATEPLYARACMLCLRKTFSRQNGASLTSLTFVFLRLSPEFTGVHTTQGTSLF